MSTDFICPCCSGNHYEHCCGPLHRGEQVAATPEALMRSRYSAFALGGLGEYLFKTWADNAPGRPPEDAAMLNVRTVDWQRLEIMQTSIHGAQGMVEFRAWYLEDGQEHVLHERSRFRRSAGRWQYVDGVIDPPAMARAGRNDPCPCGSQKKYKKCCAGQ